MSTSDRDVRKKRLSEFVGDGLYLDRGGNGYPGDGWERLYFGNGLPTPFMMNGRDVAIDGVLSASRVDAGISPGSIGAQPADATLTALSGKATGPDLLPYFTGAGAIGTTAFTAFARSLLSGASAAAMRATLGALATNGDGSAVTVKGRTLDARAGDVANVKDAPFSAKGDGATDDTAAIQAALNTGKRVVIHGPATYIISGALTIPSGGELVGIGNPVLKLKSNTSPLPTALLTNTATAASRASNVRVEGITFDGNRANNINHGAPSSGNQQKGWEGYPLAAISLGYVDGLTIRDCGVRAMWASGIWMVDCTDAVVDDCRVTDCRKSGIAARRALPTVSPGMVAYRITDCYVARCTVGIHGIFGTGYGKIAGNVVEQCSDMQAYPAFAWGGTYPAVWPTGDAQVWKHSGDAGYVSPVNLGDGAAIELSGYYTADGATQEAHIEIFGNTCKSSANGIRVEQAANYIVVGNNTCTLNDANGIFLFSSAAVLVEGNECSFNGNHGISVDKASGQPQGAYQLVSDNNIIRNNFFGVAITGSDGMLVSGNIILENNRYSDYNGGAIGIFAAATGETCDNISIHNNYVIENGKYWVYGDGAAHGGLSIRDNTFLGSPSVAKVANVMSIPGVEVRGNTGFKTRGKGTATINAPGYARIAHGLDITPSVENIRVSAVTDPGSGSRIYLSPTALTSTTFDVIQAGGSGTTTIAWSIDDQ